MIKWLHPRDSGLVQHAELNKHYPAYKRLKDKCHMIISLTAERAFDKIQCPFMIEVLERLRIYDKYHNITKVIYSKPTAHTNLNREKLQLFLLISRTSEGYLFSLYLFNVLLRATKQLEEIKGIQMGAEKMGAEKWKYLYWQMVWFYTQMILKTQETSTANKHFQENSRI